MVVDQGLDEYNIIHFRVLWVLQAQGDVPALDKKAKSDDNRTSLHSRREWNAEKAQQIVQSEIDKGQSSMLSMLRTTTWLKGVAGDKANISHGVGKDVIVMGFDCNSWALEELLNQNWN